jgi:plastocyanin
MVAGLINFIANFLTFNPLFKVMKHFSFPLCIFGVCMAIISCTSEVPNNEGGGNVPTQYITILENGFSPNNLTGANKISIGTSITFVNQSNSAHTIVSDDTVTFPARTIDPSKFTIYKRDTVGVFPYHCKEHPNMRGTIEFRL